MSVRSVSSVPYRHAFARSLVPGVGCKLFDVFPAPFPAPSVSRLKTCYEFAPDIGLGYDSRKVQHTETAKICIIPSKNSGVPCQRV